MTWPGQWLCEGQTCSYYCENGLNSGVSTHCRKNGTWKKPKKSTFRASKCRKPSVDSEKTCKIENVTEMAKFHKFSEMLDVEKFQFFHKKNILTGYLKCGANKIVKSVMVKCYKKQNRIVWKFRGNPSAYENNSCKKSVNK